MGAWIEISKIKTESRQRLVAPLVGAWIEIPMYGVFRTPSAVAPLVGAWIEILQNAPPGHRNGSVAPLVGAWIEISLFLVKIMCVFRRSPCGSVD